MSLPDPLASSAPRNPSTTDADEDCQPDPGDQRRAEVVALDVGVVIGRVEEAGDHERAARQQGERAVADRRHHESGEDEGGQRSELAHGKQRQVAELARPVTERVVDAAPELLAGDDVGEALPACRAGRRRGAPRGCRSGRRGSAARDRRGWSGSRTPRRTARMSRRRERIRRIDGEDEEPDREQRAAASASGCRPTGR